MFATLRVFLAFARFSSLFKRAPDFSDTSHGFAGNVPTPAKILSKKRKNNVRDRITSVVPSHWEEGYARRGLILLTRLAIGPPDTASLAGRKRPTPEAVRRHEFGVGSNTFLAPDAGRVNSKN